MASKKETDIEQNNKTSEQALLTEYQACQHANDSSSASYWTISGIFIGASSALLGVLVYAITSDYFSTQNHVSLVLASTAGIFVIIILCLLRLWARRVSFLQQLNFERMREIESKLGIRKNWRVHGIDNWNEKNSDLNEKITNHEKNMLFDYKPQHWWKERRNNSAYIGSSTNIFNGIYTIFVFLWAMLVVNALAILASFSITDISTVIVIAIISGIITFLAVHFTRIRRE